MSLAELLPAIRALPLDEKRELFAVLGEELEGSNGTGSVSGEVDNSPVTPEERARAAYPDIEDVTSLIRTKGIISPELSANEMFAPLIERAELLRQRVFQDLPGIIRTEWTLVRDGSGQPRAQLTLVDPYGYRAVGQFTAEELASDFGLPNRFLRIWDEVLEKRSYRGRRHQSVSA